MTVDVLAHPVTSVRCSDDGNALLVSTLDGYIRMLDRVDGKLLNAFGGPARPGMTISKLEYRNKELRVRSVFAQGGAVVLSGGEASEAGAGAFAWDVIKGEVIAAVPVGEKVKAVSCVAWNEKGGNWAAGCSDGTCSMSALERSQALTASRYGQSLWLIQVDCSRKASTLSNFGPILALDQMCPSLRSFTAI